MTVKLRRSAALLALSAVAVAASACAGGAAGGDGDPATAVPADATFYVEVVARPEGSLRDDALSAAGKVLRTDDPESEVRALVERAFRDHGLDHERDVEPWLGERVGLWLRPGRGDEPYGVLLLAATDTDAARAALERALRRDGRAFGERSHRGSDYLRDEEGVAGGIVGDFMAIGPEAAFKRTVDASEGDSLAEADAYSEAVGELEEERLAHFWLDAPGLLRHAGAEELSPLGLDDLAPVAGSFSADGEALAFEARADARHPLLRGGSTPLLQDLPGDAWLAFGAAGAGESLRETVDGLAGILGGLALRRAVQQRTGLDLDRDLLDWIGDVGVFVRGTRAESLEGGLVIRPTDEDRAADAFGRIVGSAARAGGVRPEPIDVEGAEMAFELALARPLVLARGSGLVVAATGRSAAGAALASDARLGDSDVYEEAEELVGMELSLLVSIPAVLELAAGKPEFEQARPYLEAFTVLAAGTAAGGDEVTGRLAAGLE